METLRPLLMTYAYNICGSFDDAGDIVQDAYLKYLQVEKEHIRDEKAYLVRMVINLSINRKKQQQSERHTYFGEWLPEPVATELADGNIRRKEILSYSLMILLEKLNPQQRAVFILKEAFNYEHTEIAAVLDITAEHSRQLFSRAKKQLAEDENKKKKTSPAASLHNYLEMVHSGDISRLESFLHDEVALYADGGGKVTAIKHPMFGRKPVLALLTAIHGKYFTQAQTKAVTVNHYPAIQFFDEGTIIACVIFEMDDTGLINNVFVIRNPDKLKNL
ncbi:sigma-70 family RNA polymerase sigma factor [Chitinophaga pendula]|uniref:sigma-70 family RNA polymerase sigma factor n=1 Tax=Chitinophaga TaxID=79328 RepID=UPI000BAE8210|nr:MULTISPECIES: sigma-70 family RNA polymerase sigma factor [Chitinophaga]ASZ12308.1 RNA polymerase subunit sigma-70 [Chitinophaga sp. MD30]UCJ10103.1 sigma-70 family RNA polymerase sigma factor [Chitinophaga pendula]